MRQSDRLVIGRSKGDALGGGFALLERLVPIRKNW
jgi:hypothetical protein